MFYLHREKPEEMIELHNTFLGLSVEFQISFQNVFQLLFQQENNSQKLKRMLAADMTVTMDNGVHLSELLEK